MPLILIAKILTDSRMAIPDNCYGRIASRSGQTLKHSIEVGAGVVDADYRENIGVILYNHSDVDFDVQRGERIAQMIIENVVPTNLIETKVDTTERGDKGFGSSGYASKTITNRM